MKKILLTITVLFVTLLTMAQSPNLMNFQGVARNAVGNVIPNQLIGVRLSILSGGPTGTLVYQESRNVFTNAFGLFNIVMGSPGTLSQIGTIAGVNWSGFPSGGASKFLQVEIDPNAGTAYTSVGSTQMVSVPYALNAGGAGPIGPAGGDLTGTYPNPQILIPLIKSQNVPLTPMIGMTNTSTTGNLGAIQGSSASTDPNAVGMQGTISSASPGSGSAGLRGTNNSTTANGAGVIGTQAGSGMGVLGQSASGSGVRGESGGVGAGVYGLSVSGPGVYGTSTTGNGGFFENTNNANTAATVLATTNSNGNGSAVNGVNSGTSGRGGLFQVTNAGNGSSALEAQTAGSNTSWGVRSTSTGLQGAGLFVQSNAANTANNVQSNQAGLGTAGFFQTTNTANNSDAILGASSTTGTTASGVHGTAGTSGTTLVAKKGVWGDTDNGWGVYGTSSSSVGVGGTTTTGTGVSAFAFTTGTALSAQSLTGVSASISSPAGNAATTLTATTAGTGVTGNFDNSNAANLSNTLQAINVNGNSVPTGANGGGAGLFVRKGATLTSFITNPAAVYASAADPAAGTALGVLGVSNNGFAVTGFTIGNGFGVLGQAGTAGSAGVVAFNSGTGYGLVTVGKVQIQGQGAGAGKVLSSDAVGNATWNTLAALGGVSGTGTLNYVPKWTPNGTTLGNSQIFDDGTNVGVGTGSPNGKLDVANGSATVRGMQVINSSTTNPSSTIFAQNNSVGGADPLESSAVTGLFSPILVATPTITGPSAIKGIASPTATVGFAGGIGVQGASGNGVGVAGISNNGTGVYAFGVGGTSYALQTNGRVQIQGQGAGAGKVLSSDATGNATWNTASSLNIVSGNGTLNFIPKWTPDGVTLGNSQVFDNGTAVSIGTPLFSDPNSVNIYSTTASTPNSSLLLGANSEAFGMYTENATGKLHFTANNFNIAAGNKIMTLDDDGVQGVGIGTTNPVAKLHVENTLTGNGGIRVNQPNELSIPGIKSLSNGNIINDGSVIAPGFLGNNSIYAQRGEWTGTVFVSGTETGIIGFAPTGTGVQALSVSGNGVFAGSTSGIGVRAFSQTGKAIFSTGALQFTGIGEANGRVLTSDASGNASWQLPTLPTQAVSFRAHGLPAQSTSGFNINGANTWQTIDYEQTPGASNWNGATGEYTIPISGMYHIDAQIELGGFSTPAGGRGNLLIDLNGGILVGSNHQINSANFNVLTNNTDYYFTAGQKVSMHFFLSGAGTGNLSNNYVNDNFSIHLVR